MKHQFVPDDKRVQCLEPRAPSEIIQITCGTCNKCETSAALPGSDWKDSWATIRTRFFLTEAVGCMWVAHTTLQTPQLLSTIVQQLKMVAGSGDSTSVASTESF